MARPQGEFSRLLQELRSAGPTDRVRLLARSVAALRGLSPWDRKVLLRMAGFEGAEVLVERLAGEDQRTVRALSRVLAELEKDPDELERTVRKLADPKQRGAAVDELLATLDRSLAAPAGSPSQPGDAPRAAPPAGIAPWAEPLAALAIPVEQPAPAVTPPAPPAGTVVAPSPAPATGAAPAAPDAPGGRALAPPEAAPAASAPAGPGAKAPSAARPAASRRGDQPPPEKPKSPLAPPRPPTPPPATLEPTLPEGAPSAVGTLESLLDLRRRTDGGERIDAATLRGRLEREFRFPWARRRAIQTWLSGTVGIDVDEALALIGTLPAGSDRTWCLATLAGARAWRPDEWSRIVDAARSPAARRHLELRRRPA